MHCFNFLLMSFSAVLWCLLFVVLFFNSPCGGWYGTCTPPSCRSCPFRADFILLLATTPDVICPHPDSEPVDHFHQTQQAEAGTQAYYAASWSWYQINNFNLQGGPQWREHSKLGKKSSIFMFLEKPKEQYFVGQDHQQGLNLLHTYGQLKSSFGYGGVVVRMRALFPKNVL